MSFEEDKKNQSFNGMSASEWAKHSRSVWKDLPTPKEDARLNKMSILPVELIDRIVNIYSKEEDKVLDPFMGSGSTVISAIRNNRFCYGFEIDSKTCKIAEENIVNSLNLLVNVTVTPNSLICLSFTGAKKPFRPRITTVTTKAIATIRTILKINLFLFFLFLKYSIASSLNEFSSKLNS